MRTNLLIYQPLVTSLRKKLCILNAQKVSVELPSCPVLQHVVDGNGEVSEPSRETLGRGEIDSMTPTETAARAVATDSSGKLVGAGAGGQVEPDIGRCLRIGKIGTARSQGQQRGAYGTLRLVTRRLPYMSSSVINGSRSWVRSGRTRIATRTVFANTNCVRSTARLAEIGRRSGGYAQ